ncbi:MAG: ABC transporter ATP-binding protein/permease [Rhodospirillales bacterium]|nr:ABC transporter ATP-binding protein/permease [Rhodospirillales bacterium]
MNGDLSARLSTAAGFLAKLWHLTIPYWRATEWGEVSMFGRKLRVRERWIARALLAIVLFLNVIIVWILKLANDWNARFYNALEEKNVDAFWSELRYFAVIATLFILVAVYRLWFRQMLQIRWRRWLTDVYCGEWLRDRTYYRLELTQSGSDNPEQRIQEDCDSFTTQTLAIGLGLISEVLTLVTFTAILWQLSGSITLPIMGGLEVPGYMMWVAVIYAGLGSWLTFKIGRPLVRVNFELQRSNADFRYRMIRVRENAESIALYGGEPDEGRRLQGAFQAIYRIWWDYMRYNKRLTWFTAFYGQAADVFPMVVASPRYFAGAIPFGVLTQTANAFGRVQGALSWFVDTFSILADWKATTERLTTFGEAIAAAKRAQRSERQFDVVPGNANVISLEAVDVGLPNGGVLLRDVNLAIDRGRSVVVQGPSGSGKTTLFRVIAGIWPFGHGRIAMPRDARVLFLPQRPYLPLGTLKEALSYPGQPEDYSDEACAEALAVCRLSHLANRLGESGNWALALSPGEQQRLAFARALLYRPDWLFLDEASSALDEATESDVYHALKRRLPQATLISIAHKPSVLDLHEAIVAIDPCSATVRVTLREAAE